MHPDMLVCHCQAISERKIRKAVRKGASTTAQVRRLCGAGSCCGGCIPAVREIIRDESLEHHEESAASSSQTINATA